MRNYFKKNLQWGSGGIFVMVVILFVLSPVWQMRVGDYFFGANENLYQVDFAQQLYRFATNPVLGPSHIPEYAHYQLSRTYFIQGRFKRAIEEANNELARFPENDRTYYILGLTYGYMNEEQKAIDAFGKFLESNPLSWAARNDRAWLQFRIGDLEGALATIEPVSSNLNPWVLNTYGTILLNLGRYEEALEVYGRALAVVGEYTHDHWGSAYPGNDPRVYGVGLENMRQAIEQNYQLAEKKILEHGGILSTQ